MKIVAVTACITGIAHTYMAAEALERAAKELGHEIKVETQGSGGAQRVGDGDECRAVGLGGRARLHPHADARRQGRAARHRFGPRESCRVGLEEHPRRRA